MKTITAIVIALSAMSPAVARADSWTTYRIPETGTSVDVPTSVFTEEAGKPDGYGNGYSKKLRTPDGGADLTVQAVRRPKGVSPAAFLAAKQPPPGILYKRIAPDFFVVSSIKRDKIWYDRCNFTSRYVHCVLINYPAAEKRQWDDVVTRISHSLSGG